MASNSVGRWIRSRRLLSFVKSPEFRAEKTSYSSQQCLLHSSSKSMNEESNDLSNQKEATTESEDFRVYQIEGLKKAPSAKRAEQWSKRAPPPRYHSMPIDQDWTNVWPTATTFKWSAIPFPVRQGYVENSSENESVIPSKYANLELMKGPNFLHLTPGHVKKHCKAIKHFCTKWPEGLQTEEDCHKHFPLESITADYVFAGPTLTDDRARKACIKFKLSDLDLDYHAKDKFIRLVGDRYDSATDEVTFESDRCPLKSQNLEYVKFLLTAVYFESWKIEEWEQRKELSDMEKYNWDINKSSKTCLSLLKTIKEIDNASGNETSKLKYLPEDVQDSSSVYDLSEIHQYKTAVEELVNDGENVETLTSYKLAVEKLLNLKTDV
ncbi:28S ribosomal protein s35, mitochondrial [Plakobranchus ocellatus]|uniref:28S ribosomal protein s35, mitochondrial n=1 Tax=Plakobranchus ocellatus TaxID=259542 RepID=A0AAV3ZIK4_9GAST|nr:28S ribosomal protein s35, mitochondrial [Plakobranchus ocellatus]